MKKTPLDMGFVARAAAGVRFLFTGQGDWFGAGTPPETVAPESVKGRQFDYPVYVNSNSSKPRQEERGVSFEQLRALADNYDVLRIIIERRKDQMAKLSWTIQKRDVAHTRQKENAEKDPRIENIVAFFRQPDRIHTWDAWLRMLLEDLLVLDAPCLYPRRTRGGDLYALETVDGSTIKRLLDDTGRTPLPPEPAYQQILHGMAANNYTYDELIYRPRNARTHKVYGYSPVEQIITTVNIALRRQLHQLEYYQSGSVPDALIGVPDTWSPNDIERFQIYWDMLLSGETAERRKLRFVSGDLARNFVETKQPPLKDQYDEWLARVVCFCFSVEPTPFVAQVNRATAETSREQSLSEGLAPLQNWVKSVMDDVLSRFFHAPDLEFVWDEEVAVDPKVQADIYCQYINSGVLTVDEVRAELGYSPLPKLAQSEPNEANHEHEKVEKAAKKTYRPINRERPKVVAARLQAQQIIAEFLQEQAMELGEQLSGSLNHIAKSQNGLVDWLLNGLSFSSWTKLAKKLFPILRDVFGDGAHSSLISVGVSPKGKMRHIRSLASAWADNRAAEMVGMRWVGGVLLPNPDAKWQITESTRQMLRDLVEKAVSEGWATDKLQAEIVTHTAFSGSRAAMIARTEIANADMAGTLTGWQQSGVVIGKRWQTVGDDKVSESCQECAKVGAIGLDDVFPSGRTRPANHPNCRCDLLPVLQGEEDTLNKAYNPRQPRDKNGRWTSNFAPTHNANTSGNGGMGTVAQITEPDANTLHHFAQSSMNAGNQQQKLNIAYVSANQSTQIQQLSGVDVQNYRHVLENFGVKHAFNHHGNVKKEQQRGQRAITADDFKHIPSIVNEPDGLSYQGLSNVSKQPLILYTKQIGTETYFYVAEIRRKRKELATQTMYIRP